jgi:hypothetical protein
MSEKHESQNVYIIPPNFIESGTFFGGMFKARNAIEAGILAFAVGFPIFHLTLPLTTKIIILCITSLPLALLGLIGISGESLSSFIFIFFKYLKNRRIVGGAVVDEPKRPSVNVKKNETAPQLISIHAQNAQRKKILPLSSTM